MKKMMTIAFLAVTAISYSSHNQGAQNLPVAPSPVNTQPVQVSTQSSDTTLAKYFTAAEKSQVDKNKAEIKTLLSTKEIDWKKVESLNEKNAVIMSKAATRMMQESKTATVKP